MSSKPHPLTYQQEETLNAALAKKYPDIPIDTEKNIVCTVEKDVVSASVTFFIEKKTYTSLFSLRERKNILNETEKYWYCIVDEKD